MRQTLFHIPPDILGIPTLGWGWGLVVWIAGTLLLAALSGLKDGVAQSIRQTLPVLLIGSLVIVFVLPHIQERDEAGHTLGLPIRGYGVAMFFAVAAGVALAVHRGQRMGLPPDTIYSLAMWLFIAGFAGARLFFLIQYRDSFRADSWGEYLKGAVNITQGGLVVYGSLLGALIAYGLFVWRNRLPPLAIGDLLAPSMLLGLALGRIGCLMNGCCYGGPCDYPWAVRFPRDSPPYMDQLDSGLHHGFHLSRNGSDQIVVDAIDPTSPAARAGLRVGDQIVAIAGHPLPLPDESRDDSRSRLRLPPAARAELYSPSGTALSVTTSDHRTVEWIVGSVPTRSLPVHPTQIYSAMNALVLLGLVLSISPFVRRDGMLLAITLTLYPATRFLLEVVRTDESILNSWHMTISQTVSLMVLLIAIGLWLILFRQPVGRQRLTPA